MKCLITFLPILSKFVFCQQISIEKSAIPNFTEIRSLGATMIYEDRQTDMTFIYYPFVRVQLKCDGTR